MFLLEHLMQRASIRRYQKKEPTMEVVEKIVQAGQHAPFSSQLYSVLLSRNGSHPFGAPLLFTLCADIHKLERIMEERNWSIASNDLSLLLFALQDVLLAAGQMVIAGEALGLGSCFLGEAPYKAEKIRDTYDLPPRVFPIVQLVMGYPDEKPSPRPRYPLHFVLFEDQYPQFSHEQIQEAMEVMDEGYLKQNYYENLGTMIDLQGDKEETFTFDNYSWTEHIARKWGQWLQDEKELLRQLEICGFHIGKRSQE